MRGVASLEETNGFNEFVVGHVTSAAEETGHVHSNRLGRP
jgi:hypothetical protein